MQILKNFWNEIFGGPTVEIRLLVPPDLAAQRLSENTSDWKFPLGLRDTVVGTVSVDQVVLSRARGFRALFSDSPNFLVFRGRFVVEADATYLRGQFQLDLIAKCFMASWFGMLISFSVASFVIGPVIAIEENVPLWVGFLAGLAFALCCLLFCILGYLLLRYLRWLSRSDIDRIKRHVEFHVGDPA